MNIFILWWFDCFHIHIYFKMKLCPYCMEPFNCGIKCHANHCRDTEGTMQEQQSDYYVEIMWSVFVRGHFMSPQDEWNIHIKNNEYDLHIVITINRVSMPYYNWFDIDFSGLCVHECWLVKQQYHKKSLHNLNNIFRTSLIHCKCFHISFFSEKDVL